MRPGTFHRRGLRFAVDPAELSSVAAHDDVQSNVVPGIGPIPRGIVESKAGIVVEPVEDEVDQLPHGLPADLPTVGVGIVVLFFR